MQMFSATVAAKPMAVRGEGNGQDHHVIEVGFVFYELEHYVQAGSVGAKQKFDTVRFFADKQGLEAMIGHLTALRDRLVAIETGLVLPR